jgi:uncharacterized protein (DUF58 family)
LRERAESLAAAFPALLIEADKVAQTVAHGLHGRRRTGTGETFWQYRRYRDGDTASAIDWRRSARSEKVYIRENEWEAANTVWLWNDLTGSMDFQSHLSDVSKRNRAIVLTLAMAGLLLRGGERVGILGSELAPSVHRYATRPMARWMCDTGINQADEGLPPEAQLQKFSTCVLIGDFLSPVDKIAERMNTIAGSDIHGHFVQVLDPAEETLPYEGRKEFVEMRGPLKLTIGRVESLRDAYQQKIEDHRAELAELAKRMGWTFSVHHTDTPPHRALLALYGMLSGNFATGRSNLGA